MFKKNMKKALALLASLLILCSLVPMSALLTANAAGENIVVNGDFEAGKDGWTMSGAASIVDTAHNGSSALKMENPGAWSETAIQVVSVDADSEYEIVWYSKRVSGSGAFDLFIMNNDGYANLEREGNNWMNETSGNWVKNKCTVKTGTATKVLLKFSCEAANAGVILVDDLTMVKVGGGDEPDQPADGNMLKNGDFESNDASDWENVWDKNTVEIVSGGHDSEYAMSVVSGQWAIVRQKVKVEKNTDYTITVWYKDVNKMTLLIKDGGDTTNMKQVGLSDGNSSWKKATVEFNSGDNTNVFVGVMGNEAGAKGTFDDFFMVKKGGETPDQPDQPTGDLLGNGDFETGEIAPWENLWDNNEVSFVDGRNDGKAMKVISGQWKHVRQIVNVEKNTDYVITGWYKDVTDMLLLVKDGGDVANMQSAGMNGGSDWTKVILEVNSGDNDKLIVTLMGNVAESKGTFDDFSMEKKSAGGDTPDQPDQPTAGFQNGDFETGDLTGWEPWQNTEISKDAKKNGEYGAHLKGNGGWGGLLDQTFTVTKDKTYTLSFWYKANAGGANFVLKSDGANIENGSHYGNAKKWTQITLEFTAPSAEILLNICGGGTGVAEDIYVDDFVLTEKSGDEPDNPDQPTAGFQNGDFETGDLTGWQPSQNTEISKDAKKNGEYGAHLKGDGSYGGLLDQTFAVTKDKTYTLSFWYKANAAGANFVLKSDGTSIENGSHYGSAKEWTQITLEFTAPSAEILLNICGGGTGDAEDIYVDDFVLAEKTGGEPDQPDNPDDPDEPAAGFQNGDFETGDLTGWQPCQNTEISKDAKKNGEYGAHLKGDGSYGGLLDQTFAVTKDQEYILTFWYKANAAGANFVLKNDGASVVSAWCNKTEWTKVELEFKAPSTEILLNICGGGTGVAEDIYVDDFVLAEKSPFSTELINGDFENGDEGWSLGSSASIVDEGAHGGNGALKLDNPSEWQEAAMQTVAVEKDTNYVITWYAKRVEGNKSFNLIMMDGNNQNIQGIDGASWMNETSGEWVKYEITVPTGSATEMKFKFTTEASNPGIILIDDITMIKEGEEPEPVDGNLIKNGSFENGKDDWSWKEPTELSQDAFVGEASAKLDFNAAYGEALTQTVKIKPNTDYVMIWYTRRVSGAGAWDLFLMDYDTINVTNVNIECDGQKWFTQTDKDWQESRISFNSGETTKLYVKFGPESDNSGVFLLDEVGLYVKGDEPAEPIVPPTPPKTSMYLTSYGVVNNRPITADKNMLYNGSFETAKGGQWQEGFTGDTISVVDDDTTRFGDKSLYFNTAGIEEETKLIFWLDVEADTSYVFSTWLKGKFMSDENRARATIGVVDENGVYLEMDEYKMLNGTLQIVPTAWDNEWHLRSVEFNTGSATKVGIAMSGTNSQMYIDDMALFVVGDGCKYMSENMKGSVSLSYSIDHYACEDEDCLIPDPNFNTKDESGFWADSYGWRNNVLSFVDNEYEYGTSMKYTASDRRAALSTIKWVDLEKETQYIFAVDLKILKDGFGKLVLFDDKLKDKINFLEISFDSYDYDPEASRDGWYTIVCNFNTEVYERIGIAIVDDGGEVLLDNMRLFKKSDGAEVEDDYIAPPTTTTTTEPTTEWTDTTTEWTEPTTEWTEPTTEWTDTTTEWTDATTEWTEPTTEWTDYPTWTYPTYTYPTWTYPTYTYPTYTYPTWTYPEWTDATTEWTDATTEWTDATTEWTDATTEWTDATTEWTDATTEWTDATTEWTDATTEWTDYYPEWTDATTEWTDYYPEYTYPYYPEYTYPYYPEYTYPYYPEYTYPYYPEYTYPYYPEYTYPTDMFYPTEFPTDYTEPTWWPGYTTVPTEPTEPSQPVEGDGDVFSTIMLWVGISAGVAAVLGGGGFVAIMLIKKRKKAEDEIEIPEE